MNRNEYQKMYNQKNREKKLQQYREYYANNKDKFRQYYLDKIEKVKEYSANRYLEKKLKKHEIQIVHGPIRVIF